MLAFEVHINGESVTLAGNAQMSVLSAIVTAVGRLGPESAGTNHDPNHERIDLHVGGMTAPSNGQPQEYVDWIVKDLAVGDQIMIRILQSDHARDPERRRAAGTREAQERAMFAQARETYLRLREKYEGGDEPA